MALEIVETTRCDVTRLVCPGCGEKVGYVGLLRNSRTDGLTFKCKKCGRLWAVKAE